MYVQLLEQNPDNSALLATLGSLYGQAERWGLAIHFLEHAVSQGLDQPDVFTNLGMAYTKCHQREKAKANFVKSIEKDPTAEALTNYSAMFIESGESKFCAELCERSIAMKPDQPIAHWNLALSLLGDGIWERAWDEHEWGLKSSVMREDRKLIDVPFWNGEPGTVYIYGEQGIGDEIMFASMLPDILKTNKVVLECHKRLETLFKKSFPEILVFGTREDKEIKWDVPPDFKIDYRLSIGSLGKFYRRSRESFPGTKYLKADPVPKNKFRIGISWNGGGAKVGRVLKRSIPLTWWKPILDVKNVEFVSLQYTDEGDALNIMKALGYDIKFRKEVLAEDYYETARLVASCDLVITVCTSVVHLAGALGVPCWVLTPRFPAWRYQNEGPMPWYRSVRLYRSPSPTPDAWRPVIDLVGIDLEELVNGKVKKTA